MSDDRKTSASDELLDRAREGASSEFGEFETDPIHAPDYGDMFDLDPAAGSVDDGMSAADIAAQLAEMGAVEAPDTGHQTPDAPDQASEAEAEPVEQVASIPEWARGESQEIPIQASGHEPPVEAPPAWSDAAPVDDGGDRWNTASSEWEAYQAERDAKRAARSRFDIPIPGIRTLIGIAVLGFFLIPVLFNAVSGREHISSVDVGDCFMAGDGFEIETVPVVDCSEEHDSELFAKVDASGLGSAYPGEDFLFDWAFDGCEAEFEGYVGEPYEDSPYYLETLIPLEDGWGQGDHIVLCTVVVVNSNLEVVVTTGSRRGVGGNDNA